MFLKWHANLSKLLRLLHSVCSDGVGASLAPKMFHSPIPGYDSMTVNLLNQRYPRCTLLRCPPKAPLDFWKEMTNATITINSNFSFILFSGEYQPCAKLLALACSLQQILLEPIQFVLFRTCYVQKYAYNGHNEERYGWIECHLRHRYLIGI